MKKKPDALRRNRNKKFSTDKVQKSSFLNSIHLSAEYNRCLLNSLNNIYKNYAADYNMKDIGLYNNLRNTGYHKILDIKNRLKHSFQLLRRFDDKFIFNRIQNKVKNDNSELLSNLYQDENIDDLLNISSISKKSKKSIKYQIGNYNNPININNKYSSKKIIFSTEYQNFPRNTILKETTVNNNESRNKSASINKRNISHDNLILNKVLKNMNKASKSTNLDKKVVSFNKKDNNMIPKRVEKLINSSRNQNQTTRPKSCSERYNINLSNAKKPYISYKSFRRTSSPYNKTNETSFNKNNKNKYLNCLTQKSKNYNTNNLKQNYTNDTNTRYSGKNSRNIIYSNASFQNISKNISTPFLFSAKNNSRHILSKKFNETKNQMSAIISSAINKSKKINNIISKNYSINEKPRLIIKESQSSDNKKFDWTKIRKELKLKDSNGLLAKINEIELLEEDLKKNKQKINNKKRFNIIRSIAKGIIKQDLLLNKELIYNVGIDNRKQTKKYFKLYSKLTGNIDSKSMNLNKKNLVEKYVIN